MGGAAGTADRGVAPTSSGLVVEKFNALAVSLGNRGVIMDPVKDPTPPAPPTTTLAAGIPPTDVSMAGTYGAPASPFTFTRGPFAATSDFKPKIKSLIASCRRRAGDAEPWVDDGDIM